MSVVATHASEYLAEELRELEMSTAERRGCHRGYGHAAGSFLRH